jgi:multiple antibiotic resistance protein
MDSLYAFLKAYDLQQFISCFFMLFAALNVPGTLAVTINMRKKGSYINAPKIAVVGSIILLSFLLIGQYVLTLFGVDNDSFILAGSVIILLLGLEMCLNISIFKGEADAATASVVPLAFPIIVGPGTLSTLLILKAEHQSINIMLASLSNLALIFFVLQYSEWLEARIGKLVVSIIQKLIGLILIAIAIQRFKAYLFV